MLRLGRSPFDPTVAGRMAAVGLLLTAAGVALGWALTAATPTALDLAGLRNLDGVDGWRLTAMRALSTLAGLAVLGFLAAVAALWSRARAGGWDFGLLVVVVLGGSQFVAGVVKLATARDRPDAALTDTLNSAFPSGHAVRAAVVYGLLSWLAALLVRSPALRLAVAAVAASAIVGTSLARVALGAHWPTDVVAGAVLGTVWLVASLWLLAPRLEHRPNRATGARNAAR